MSELVKCQVLGYGNICLDIINVVKRYPPEDSEVRVLRQLVARGGNASNSLVVLSQLGAQATFLGPCGSLESSKFVLEDLKKYHISSEYCVIHPDKQIPTSYILLSAETSTRSIAHFRELPELSFEDFLKVLIESPSTYDWVHFEGRNIKETVKMMAHLRAKLDQWESSQQAGKDTQTPSSPQIKRAKRHSGQDEKSGESVETIHNNNNNNQLHPPLPCTMLLSVEIEKAAPNIETLIPFANVVFFSKDYARAKGFQDPVVFLKDTFSGLSDQNKKTLVCAWGDKGAAAIDSFGDYKCDVFKPHQVVDTIGAGDTFIGAFIFKYFQEWKSKSPSKATPQALEFAVKVAGVKCGQHGFGNLVDAIRQYDEPSTFIAPASKQQEQQQRDGHDAGSNSAEDD